MGQQKVLSRLQQPVAQTTAHRKSTSSSQQSAEQGIFQKLGNRRRQRQLKGQEETETSEAPTPRQMFEAANDLYQGGEYQKALDAFNAFVAAHGNHNGIASYNIAQCYYNLGRRDLAIELFQKCLAEGMAASEYAAEIRKKIEDMESEQKPNFDRGQQAFQKKDYKTALRYYMRALEAGMARRSAALFNIAQCNRLLKRYDNALLFYQEALDAGIGEYETEVMGRIEEMRVHLGMKPEISGEVTPLSQDDISHLFFKGDAEMKLGHYEKALALFTELHDRVGKSKKPGVSYFNMAQCNRLLSRFAVALYLYEQAIKSNVGEYERETQDRIFEMRKRLGVA